MFSQVPYLGVGLGYRSQVEEGIRTNASHIDWLELITDHYLLPAELADVKRLRSDFPLVPHGLELSIAGEEPLDDDYVDRVASVVDAADAPWFSDHLCYTRGSGVEVGALVPAPRTPEVAARVAERAELVQRRVGRPLLLENITYYFALGPMTESEFLAAVFDRCSCGLLLDLTNVYTNATNHHFNTQTFLDSIPLDRVLQVHVAGGEEHNGLVMDSHSRPVPGEVWEMLRYISTKAPIRGVLLERDQDFSTDLADILADLDTARRIMNEAGFPDPTEASAVPS